MAVKVILDTDILSEYLKGYNTSVANRAAIYAKDHGVFTFTSITVYEIVYGLELKGAFAQLKKVMTWLKQNEEITPIDADYLRAATIKAKARKQGSVVELPDCLIASMAARMKRSLVTGNTEDFQAIQKTGVSLSIENWR
jgi:predicted nucleic acid-binding protein